MRSALRSFPLVSVYFSVFAQASDLVDGRVSFSVCWLSNFGRIYESISMLAKSAIHMATFIIFYVLTRFYCSSSSSFFVRLGRVCEPFVGDMLMHFNFKEFHFNPEFVIPTAILKMLLDSLGKLKNWKCDRFFPLQPAIIHQRNFYTKRKKNGSD